MSRNTGGTYSLPSGNPVVSGTTIASTWANDTLGDLASEMTDSLSRSGKGAMMAPLKIADGTAAAPALTWAGDPDSGIYRAGAGDVRMQVDATQAQRWTATGSTLPVPVTVTTAVANTVGVTVTGNGAGAGISATGGATSANGVAAVGGAPNGDAVYGQGTGTGTGLVGSGGTTSGPGVEATGGAPNGVGLVAIGAGAGSGVTGTGGTTGSGGTFTPGTAASATVRSSAIVATSGDVVFSSVTNPNSDVVASNRLTAKNIVKAWVKLTKAAAGGVSVTDGFNIASVSVSTTTATLTFASAFASTDYAVVVTSGGGAPYAFFTNVTSTTAVELKARNLAAGGSLPLPELDFAAVSGNDILIYVAAVGAQ